MNPDINKMRCDLAFARREMERISLDAAQLIPEIRDCLQVYGEDLLLQANILGAQKKLKKLDEMKKAYLKHQETAAFLSKELGDDE